jgi:hypothetical protein
MSYERSKGDCLVTHTSGVTSLLLSRHMKDRVGWANLYRNEVEEQPDLPQTRGHTLIGIGCRQRTARTTTVNTTCSHEPSVRQTQRQFLSQDPPDIFWNPKVHYSVIKSLQIDLTQSHMNPVHSLGSNFLNDPVALPSTKAPPTEQEARCGPQSIWLRNRREVSYLHRESNLHSSVTTLRY